MAVYTRSFAEEVREIIDHLEVSYTAPYEFVYLEGEQPNKEEL